MPRCAHGAEILRRSNLMVELDPHPILVRSQHRVSAMGARRETDSGLTRGEVEEVQGMVREGRRGMRRSNQAELDLVGGDPADILALVLEQDDDLSRSTNAAR